MKHGWHPIGLQNRPNYYEARHRLVHADFPLDIHQTNKITNPQRIRRKSNSTAKGFKNVDNGEHKKVILYRMKKLQL